MDPENDRSTASALDGLPDVDRKETEEILKEIEQDENKELDKGEPKPKEKDKDSEEDEGDDKKPEADKEKKPDDEGKERKTDKDKEGKEEKQPRSPKLMPRYAHEIAMKNKEKEIEALTTKLSQYESKTQPSKTEDAPKNEDLEKEIAKLAEEHKLDPQLLKSLAEITLKHSGIVPADLQKDLAALKEARLASEITAEETKFSEDFKSSVLPLIEAEYGDLDKDTIEKIEDEIKAKAYSEEFGKVPLKAIYKGLDEFRNFSRTTKKSAEPSRGGAERTVADMESEEAIFENASEDDVSKMDPATFDRYTIFMEKKETGRIRQF